MTAANLMRYERAYHQAAEAAEVKPHEAKLLVLLAQEFPWGPGPTSADIGELLGADYRYQSDVRRSLSHLRRRGFVKPTKRGVLRPVELTRTGHGVAKKIESRVWAAASEAVAA